MGERDKGGATNIRESLLNPYDRAAITFAALIGGPIPSGLVELVRLEKKRLEKVKKLDKPPASSTA